MSAGRFDSLIKLESYTATQDAAGEEVQTWQPIGHEWADVNFGRGDERRQAAMEQGRQPATFTVNDNSQTRGLKVRDRISFEGGEWDIDSNVPGRRSGERDITALRAT